MMAAYELLSESFLRINITEKKKLKLRMLIVDFVLLLLQIIIRELEITVCSCENNKKYTVEFV